MHEFISCITKHAGIIVYMIDYYNMYCILSRSAQARAHASLGYVYELLQDTDKAIDHYEQVCITTTVLLLKISA